ncbi:P-loop containing nucleoside triphosphate hydrolase protein [Chlamydoabsidia padenii]|nr:P-loop containing nucleoside triphosphate hydrolase protein [Chlamydoabsidia padenii]
METTAVRVALRIRPLSEKELALAGSSDCINYAKDEPQVILGNDKAFTFDHVFSPKDKQDQVFTTSIIPLLDRFLDGNNATVLAYGQTGSGKTYSIGTSLESFPDSESQGIIQRFAKALFERLEQKKKETIYQVYVSYLELYNEEIIDLLSTTTQSSTTTTSSTKTTPTPIKKDDGKQQPAIREDIHGQIYWTGVHEILVTNKQELLEHVKKGSLSRSTGSTAMNASSSRSHAILSVTLKQQISELGTLNDEHEQSLKRLVSKFHFVDLAGSERLKRTNAFGDRQKEGISINTGLLALGNVISALGDESKKSPHVPYRDSKLTRLLQDSLGGNSHTLMLACVSPCASDYMETLNTLKYANRARNIQNQVEINVDYEGSGPEEVVYLKNQLIKMKTQLSNLLQQQHQQQSHYHHHHQRRHYDDINGEYHFMEAELIRAKMYATSMAKDVAQLQAERDLLRHSSTHDPLETQPQTMEYLQHIQDLKYELAEANNRLVHLECQQQYQSHHHQPSVSVALPGRFGSNSPTHRRNKPNLSACGTPLDRSTRTGSLSTGGRRTIRQRKHSIPIGQRMKTARKHTSFMTAPNSPPDLDELWRFLDSDSNDSTLTELRDDNQSIKSHNEVKLETKQQDDNKSIGNDGALLPAYTSPVDSMIQPNSTKLDISTTPQSSPPSMLPDSPVSTNTMSHDSILHDNGDNDDDIQILAIPAWTDEPKTQSTTDSTKRESLSWTDSLLDDSDNSIATSRLSSTYYNMAYNGKKSLGRRQSKDMLKMLHQVQADLLVKKELVGQLEKSEDEYAQMRINYEDQLKSLQNHLVDMRYQRDYAIGDIQINNMMNTSNINNNNNNNNNHNSDHPDNIKSNNKSNQLVINTDSRHHQVTKPKLGNIRQRRLNAILSSTPPPPPASTGNQSRRPQDSIPRQIKEIRLQYEGKIKRLTTENQEWKRKYQQTTNSMTTARTKAEQVVTKLRSTIDHMKMEKKQLQRSLKQENDRLRDQLSLAEQEVQQLKRKEGIFLDARRKWDDTNEHQQALLKKRNEQTIQVNQQMRQLNVVLRKAATEGTLLNEAALERLLALASTSPTSPTPL